jgi:DNA-binding CsgD family transcriptional regulator/tetratricopeptide (TPR) repeat protein
MSDDSTDALAEGRRALAARDWQAARGAYASVLRHEEHPEALDGFGLAAWLLGDVEEGLGARQRACGAYAAAGKRDEAARVGAWVSHQYLISGRRSLANGWLERAERALGGRRDGAGYGWVELERARRAASVGEASEGACRAMELGRAAGDDDLEVFALSLIGRSQISAGDFDEGMRSLEEAMAAATGGRIGNPHTLGEAYCNLIVACTDAGDWDRASEWCDLVDDYADRSAMMPLVGACRTIHAEVLVATGRWGDAESSLADALAAHARAYPAMGAPTLSALASLRIRQGRLAEAEQLLARREEDPASLLALAELRLAEGAPRVAAGLIERGLAAAGDDVLWTSRLLAPLVDARLAGGEPDAAHEVTGRLERLATTSGRPLVEARAQLAAARVALADGQTDEAREHARLALESYGRLRMPYDAAEARLELARALAADLTELAEEEARAAHAAFRGLGAARGMDAASAVLRDLGAGTAGGPRAHGELTAREREVLALVARGMTNGQIGRTLFISEKTAGHHVSRILAKLGVRNRAEAATYAARLDAAPEAPG